MAGAIDLFDSVTKTEDGSFLVMRGGQASIVPNDPANRDRQQIDQWTAAGGKILPFVPPPAPEGTFTWLQFMDLFTEAEQVELAGAAMTDPTMKLWYDRALGAQGIYLSDERTIAGVNHAAEQGLITNARRDAVLRGEAPNV